MKFDTVIRMPIANTGPHLAPESPVEVSADADTDFDLPLLALLSQTDPSGDPGVPDSSIPAGESPSAGPRGTIQSQPVPAAEDSPAANSEMEQAASTAITVPGDASPAETDHSAEAKNESESDPIKAQKDALEAIKALAPDVADHMKKLLESSKTPASVKLRVLEIILERTYGRVETAVKLSSNAHQSVEASQTRIAAIVERIQIQGEQIRMVFDDPAETRPVPQAAGPLPGA